MLGATMLVAVATAGVAYAREAWLGAPLWPALPGMQKVATALVLGWMASGCGAVWQLGTARAERR